MGCGCAHSSVRLGYLHGVFYLRTILRQGIAELQHFIKTNAQKIVVVADKHTLAECYPLLEADLPHFIVPYGENYKNLNSCEYIWKKLTELEANRNTILLCLGGGVLCDMASFSGACYQRGMRVVLVPTSLLAMVDASAGGKTGVNFLTFKNYIGLFSEAEETFICPIFLNTLPQKEVLNGYVEMLKHGLIADRNHYDAVKYLLLRTATKVSEQLIVDSIAIKKRHVVQDFKDTGIRKRLNFGHTIGHAIESHSLTINEENESLSHGMSVALGILVEAFISHKEAGLPEQELHEISMVLQPLLSSIADDIPDLPTLLPYLLRDKKNENTQINFSLLKSIGECQQDYYVPAERIEEGLQFLKNIK